MSDGSFTTTAVAATTADWVDPRAMLRDPFDTYDRLREQGSVVWVPNVSEQLPLGRTALAAPPAEADAEPTNNFVVRVIPVDLGSAPSSSGTDDPPQDEPAVPAATPVGEPS